LTIYSDELPKKGSLSVFVALLAMLASVSIALIAFAQGPVGPESVVAKELTGLVSDAAMQIDSRVVQISAVSPDSVNLPLQLELKRRLRRVTSFLNITYPVSEKASAFSLREKHGQAIKCVAVVRGDHAIGFVIEHSVSQENLAMLFRAALETKFPGYDVKIDVAP
jgi:hypothetical protein